MKKICVTSLLIICLSFISLGIHSQTVNSIDEKWKAIDQLLEEQLPESALKNLEELQLLATKADNKQALIKAQLYHYRIQMDKDPDTASKVLSDFEGYISTFKPSAEKQLLYYMLGDLYFTYYQNNQYTIQQRTEMAGELPTDVETWTKNHFKEKITSLLINALSEKQLIQNTSVSSLNELLVQDLKLLALTPTLYDLIAYKKIELMKSFDDDQAVKDTYEQLIQFRRTKNATELLVIAEVNYYKELYQGNQPNTYVAKLDSLEKVYKGMPAVVEVLHEQANYYLQHKDIKGNTKRAYEISKKGLQDYPDYHRIGLLQNSINQIETKQIQLKAAQAAKPNSRLKLELETTNVGAMTIEVSRLNITAEAYQLARLNRGNNADKATEDKKLTATLTLNILLNDNFEATKTDYFITTGEYGIYEYIAFPSGKKDPEKMVTGYFTVTDFSFIARNITEDKKAYYVVDRLSGESVKDVNVYTYTNQWDKDHYTFNQNDNGKTNNKGYVEMKQTSRSYNEIVIFKKGKDQYFTSSIYSTYFRQTMPNKERQSSVSIFTDRAIYRPGQTVYFKAIAYESSENNEAVIPNKAIKLELIDANGKIISIKELSSNQYGSVAEAFILPSDGLNGTYKIRANNQYSESFLVEAYKRPNFEVLLTQPEQEISFGTTVTILGEVKAYAAYGMANTKINYTISRYVHPYWRWFPPMTEKMVASGEAITDADGKFSIAFTPEKDDNITDKLQKQSYQYKIQVDATDQKGESQQGSLQLSVSEQSLFILAEVPALINKQKINKLNISTETILGKKIEQTVHYKIFALKDTTEFIENLPTDYQYTTSKSVLEGSFNTQTKALTIDFSSMKSGRYTIELTTNDKSGKEVKTSHVFVLYDQNDKRPPIKTYAWLPTVSVEGVVGQKTTVTFGTSAKDAHVLFEVMYGNKILSSEWITMNNTIRYFKVPFTEKYKSGISVHFTYIKDEKLIHKQVMIIEKRKEKKLTPRLTVFRDKLLPGENATWTINIPEVLAHHYTPELMIGMYDASLDAIQPHSWNFNPSYAPIVPFSVPWTTASTLPWTSAVYIPVEYIEVPELFTPSINWFGLNLSNRRDKYPTMYIRGASKSTSVQDAVGGLNEIKMEVMMGSTSEQSSLEVQLEGTKELVPAPLQQKIRSNFNETAFFYPQLYCDSLGNYNFSFTVPESLTRWNLKMLAHTNDLFVGQGEASVITQQDLMVQLNMPRFVRQSDKIMLSANVINLSDTELTTSVKFSFIDPTTNKVLVLNDTSAVKISLAPGVSQSLSWETKGFAPHELLICKIEANAGSYSDGEQRYLAVLPDKVLVTESYPIIIRGGQEKQFTYERINQMADKVETHHLTLEFSSNPIWYAIQALPALSTPTSENAIDYFVAWYVNTLAGKIIADRPKIQQIFEQIHQTGNKDALQSALAKNPELKNLLLEETPWMMEANNETEQKLRIALLFELNQQRQQRTIYFEKLKQLHWPNGSFKWFKAMQENRWVTQQITEGLLKTAEFSNDPALTMMINKAVEYLDGQITKDFVYVKLNVKDYQKVMTITPLQLQYLTMRTRYKDVVASATAQEAIDYYLLQTEKYRNKFGLYDRAMAALILYQTDKKSLAEGIIKSLKETAVKSPDKGMYWANNKAGYFWNERPISVHTRVMEAFAIITANAVDLNEMKIWLLQQKQTQQWDSPISSVEAIDALLKYGNDWSSRDEQYSIKLGNKTLETSKGIPGTVFIKQTVNIQEVKNGMTISSNQQSPNASPAWGSLYWQYYQDMDKVTSSGVSLKVEKQLFVERIINNKKTLLAINSQNVGGDKQFVKTGDKVITRMVVTTDRNLEFVALKDHRSANLEPIDQLSGSQWKENTVYYRTIKDASTNYFFNNLQKGTYVFEDVYFVNAAGDFSGGTASIQCLYAPEYIGTSKGERIVVDSSIRKK